MQPNSQPDERRAERLDRAVADRLAKLRSTPVDLTALRRAVEARTGVGDDRAAARPRRRPLVLRWLSPMRAAAASLLVGGLVVTLIVASASGPVLASADRLADIHQTLVAGGGHGGAHVQTVNSVEAANAFFASRNPGGPAVPGMPDEHVMACCVHHLGPKKMSCVSLV
jgi:hypothetical protein